MPKPPPPTRRTFLRGLSSLTGLAALAGGGVSLLPRRARALGEAEKLTIAQIIHGGTWQPRPTALRRLLWEVDKRTSIDVRLDAPSVRLGDAALYQHPLLYLAGEGALPPPADMEVERLRRHLQAGGLLIIDSAEARPGGPFDRGVRALCARLLPSQPLARLGDDHVIWKSFYLVREPPGRVLVTPWLEAVIHDGRAAIVYCQNDLGGAWARDSFGRWEHEVVPGGEDQREMSFRFGVNLVLYATCLDYKTDQVHVPFILRRRRWRVEERP